MDDKRTNGHMPAKEAPTATATAAANAPAPANADIQALIAQGLNGAGIPTQADVEKFMDPTPSALGVIGDAMLADRFNYRAAAQYWKQRAEQSEARAVELQSRLNAELAGKGTGGSD